jgi:hypothetical protein
MFYDTTILANADLTTPAGKEYFYVNVRDFYSRIPPKYWAAIGGKPIVWLYDTLWVAKFDQSSLDYLSDRFAQDFGGLRPYNANPAFTVAEVGPGFSNTAYCKGGPARNCFNIDRAGGAAYKRQLTQAVASNRKIMAVETWNEFSEGTDVSETTRYGRLYIDLTRLYADRFKARPLPRRVPTP